MAEKRPGYPLVDPFIDYASLDAAVGGLSVAIFVEVVLCCICSTSSESGLQCVFCCCFVTILLTLTAIALYSFNRLRTEDLDQEFYLHSMYEPSRKVNTDESEAQVKSGILEKLGTKVTVIYKDRPGRSASFAVEQQSQLYLDGTFQNQAVGDQVFVPSEAGPHTAMVTSVTGDKIMVVRVDADPFSFENQHELRWPDETPADKRYLVYRYPTNIEATSAETNTEEDVYRYLTKIEAASAETNTEEDVNREVVDVHQTVKYRLAHPDPDQQKAVDFRGKGDTVPLGVFVVGEDPAFSVNCPKAPLAV
jgi:hypothetical protein